MTGITFDSRSVLRTFASLEVKEMRKVHRAALAKSANVLVRDARMKLQAVSSRAGSTRTADRRGWSRLKGKGRIGKLTDGVRMYVSRDSDFAKVHIMKDFRLKFFELGTSQRKTRQGHNRGMMASRPFFVPAVNASKARMSDTMSKTIADAVIRRVKS